MNPGIYKVSYWYDWSDGDCEISSDRVLANDAEQAIDKVKKKNQKRSYVTDEKVKVYVKRIVITSVAQEAEAEY